MTTSSKFEKLKFYQQKKVPVSELEPVKCQNCGFEFQGHFCPDCGQEVAEFNRPFGFIIYDFVGNLFAFDTRLARTFKGLLIRPGFLTVEFFRGRRTTYSPPFRIFVFLSFVLFLFLQILSERSLDVDMAQLGTPVSGEKPAAGDSIDVNALLKERLRYEIDSVNLHQVGGAADSTHLSVDISDILFSGGKLRDKLNQIAEELEASLPAAKSEKESRKLRSYIAMCRNPEMALSNVLKYLSWAFFILLPLFALILKLFYIRRKQNYIRHLIFSIHLHSFLFIILIVITGLRLIFDSGVSTVSGILLLSFPVYFVVALRKFYGQGYLKTFVKFLGISASYNVVLVSVVLFVFLKSFQII